MEITNHIIANFFEGKCSPDEEQEVLLFFENHPYALNDYLHYDTKDNEAGEKIDGNTSDRLLGQIHQKIRMLKIRRRMLQYGTVIIIIGFTILGSIIILNRHDIRSTVNVSKSNNLQVSIPNNSDRQKIILLPDSSIATLHDKSCISFPQNFSGPERCIIVEGEADFKVAHDPQKPFIVVSNNIAIKALGTNFKVRSNSKKIIVQLYEGKVVVWNNKNENDKKYYLNPNHQIEYIIDNNIFTASSFGLENKNQPPAKVNSIKQPSKKEQTIAFQNIPLPSVLDKLANIYDVRIEYSAKDLEKIYIIADYSKDESIQKLLQNIANINNLKLVKVANNSYYISR